jgi:hypothetical protein
MACQCIPCKLKLGIMPRRKIKKITLFTLFILLAGATFGQERANNDARFTGKWSYVSNISDLLEPYDVWGGVSVMYFYNDKVDRYMNGIIHSRWSFTTRGNLITFKHIASYELSKTPVLPNLPLLPFVNNDDSRIIDVNEYWFSENYLFLKDTEGTITKFVKVE